jgi:hypothetical protein
MLWYWLSASRRKGKIKLIKKQAFGNIFYLKVARIFRTLWFSVLFITQRTTEKAQSYTEI